MKIKSAKVAILLLSLATLYLSRSRWSEVSYPEDSKVSSSSLGNDIFSTWKLSGSQKHAIIAESYTIRKIRGLKEFQSLTHSILLRQELDFPRKIEEIENFMYELNLQPEYWKTTLPAIFDPRGRLVPSYDGLWLEFGVKAGGSIVYPAVLHGEKIIHGFDSFEGLPKSKYTRDTPWSEGKHRVDLQDSRIVRLKNRLPNVFFHKVAPKSTL